MVESAITEITEIECLGNFDDEYVYDIGIDHPEHHWFFANNILVHNSSYFSAWPVVKDEVEAGTMEFNKDTAVQLYDNISDQVNDSFPIFMADAFNCAKKAGTLIRGGREIVAERGLYITKKRYAVLVYDNEGERLDVDGKPGKVKAMGLDLKRSDTPKAVQTFLSDILFDTLTGVNKQGIMDKISAYKGEFAAKTSWEKGTPRRVNNLTKYTALENGKGKARLPGHVRAAMNWNILRNLNGDKQSMEIVDGQKTIMCKLKPNPMGYTSVSYPIDESRLPKWFTELAFDDQLMEETIVDKKIENLLGVLNWDLKSAYLTNNTFSDFFS